MLREVTASKRTEGALERRWYQDDLFDLYVWLDTKGTVTHFQLAYDKPTVEKALDWKRDTGFEHFRVDDHAEQMMGSVTPLLVMDPEFPKQRIIREFDIRASSIHIGIADFVAHMLRRAPRVYYRDTTIKWVAAGVLAGALLLMWRLLR